MTALHYIVPLALIWCATGLYQGVFYTKGASKRPNWIKDLAANLHRLQNPMNWFVKACYAYMLFAAMYGFDWRFDWWTFAKMAALSFTAAHATMRLLNPLRQGFINRGNNLPWIDGAEQSQFELILPGMKKGIWLPKPFGRGWGRFTNSVWWATVLHFILTWANTHWL